jgi:anaerobic selenocysteine-containing dehydrogenase
MKKAPDGDQLSINLKKFLEATLMVDRAYRTICQFCHTNCGIIVHRDADGGISVFPP